MQKPIEKYHHGDLKAAVLVRAAEIIEEEGIEALSLRAIARDLGVSHGAPNRHYNSKADLLAALAKDGWEQIRTATLTAAEQEASDDPRAKLNAMGRGFLSWALQNKSAFISITHPDVGRHAEAELYQATESFKQTIHEAVLAAQLVGRHPDVDPTLLALYTNSVPFGLAMLLLDPLRSPDVSDWDVDEMVGKLIDLVVPLGE